MPVFESGCQTSGSSDHFHIQHIIAINIIGMLQLLNITYQSS